MTQTKKFAQVISPGIFLANESTKEVEDTNPAHFTLPDGAIGVRFYEQTFTEMDGEMLSGSPKNHTGWYYRGKMVTKDAPGIGDILKSNLTINEWRGAVQYGGVTYPLNDQDVIYWND